MTNGLGYTGGPLRAGPVLEHTRFFEDGFVLTWNASGPLSARDTLANEKPEFAFLALDTEPVQLYIKRSPRGVYPIVWDLGPSVPNFTLAEITQIETNTSANAAVALASATASANNRQAIEQLLGLVGNASGLAAIILAVFDALPVLPTDGVTPITAGWYKNGDANGFSIIRVY